MLKKLRMWLIKKLKAVPVEEIIPDIEKEQKRIQTHYVETEIHIHDVPEFDKENMRSIAIDRLYVNMGRNLQAYNAGEFTEELDFARCCIRYGLLIRVVEE